MLINVKTLNGPGFSVEVEDEGTIKDLKILLTEKCGWEPDNQKIIYRGRVLQDEQTYKDASLENGTALHLVHKIRSADRVEQQAPTSPPDEIPGIGHDGMQGIHIETTPEMVGISVPPHTDPAHAGVTRLETLRRMIARIEALVRPLENAILQAGDRTEENANSLFEPAEPDLNADVEMTDTSESTPGDATANSQPAPNIQAAQNLTQYRELMLEVLGLTNRILPLADVVSQAVVFPGRYTERGGRSLQPTYDTMAILLHEMSHLLHGMGDFVVDLSKPPESRSLRVPQRVQVEHRALLSTAITIPMTAVGVPNIGNLIAQQLNQMPGAHMGMPVGVGMSVHAVNNPNGQQNGSQEARIPTNPLMARPEGPAIQTFNLGTIPTVPNGPNETLRDRLSQSIADRVSSIIGQIENRNPANVLFGLDNADGTDIARILPCASHLNSAASQPPPAMESGVLSGFSSRFVSASDLASDMLCLASHPTAFKLMQFIHGRVDEARLELDVEISFVKSVVKDILYQNDICVLYGLTYSADGINFEPVIEDFKTRLTVIITETLRRIKDVITTKSEAGRRKVGLLEVFHATVPILMQDLKCLFGEDLAHGRGYFKLLSEKVFPDSSMGTRVLLQEELCKYFLEADAKLSKYHGKIKGVELLPKYEMISNAKK